MINEFPGEIMFGIIKNLSDEEIAKGRLVCSRWNRLLHDPILWRGRSLLLTPKSLLDKATGIWRERLENSFEEIDPRRKILSLPLRKPVRISHTMPLLTEIDTQMIRWRRERGSERVKIHDQRRSSLIVGSFMVFISSIAIFGGNEDTPVLKLCGVTAFIFLLLFCTCNYKLPPKEDFYRESNNS